VCAAINYVPSIGNFLTMVLLSFLRHRAAAAAVFTSAWVEKLQADSEGENGARPGLFSACIWSLSNVFVIPIANSRALVIFSVRAAVDSDMYVLGAGRWRQIRCCSAFGRLHRGACSGRRPAHGDGRMRRVWRSMVSKRHRAAAGCCRRGRRRPRRAGQKGFLATSCLRIRRLFSIFANHGDGVFLLSRALATTQLAAIGPVIVSPAIRAS